MITVHETYEVSENLICHLCDFAVPVNIFRGAIDGNCNPLALQIDHVIPRALGGSDDPSNLKPSHAFCNQSKSKFEWDKGKRNYARKRISILLNNPLDAIWTLRNRDNTCIFEDCKKVARAGDFWQYCVTHARFMGENPRSPICRSDNCENQARSKADGFCTTHAKANGIIPFFEQCFIDACKTKARISFEGRNFCQKHARVEGLAHFVEPGVRDKAAHIARHKELASRGCYFCVEIEKRTEYLIASEIEDKDKSLSIGAFRKKYKLSEKSALHYLSVINLNHSFEDCSWCILIKSMRDRLIEISAPRVDF